MFNAVTHVEYFIIHHKGTLRKLWLMHCRIAIDDLGQEAPRQWSHIWIRFARELKVLVVLVVRPEMRIDEYDIDDYN